jgi:hypothetical protein
LLKADLLLQLLQAFLDFFIGPGFLIEFSPISRNVTRGHSALATGY